MPVVVLLCTIANVIGSLYLLNVAWVLPTLPVLLVLALALTTTLCSLVPQARAGTRA